MSLSVKSVEDGSSRIYDTYRTSKSGTLRLGRQVKSGAIWPDEFDRF